MYTTQTNIENKLKRSLNTQEAAYFTNVLDAAIDTYINNATETQFGSQTPTTIYVHGNDGKFITIPTMHLITAVTTLQEDGTDDQLLVEGTDYFEYPRGGTDIYALRRVNSDWTEGVENIKITGNYGYNDIPEDIVHVATEIAVNVLTEDTNNYKSEKVGDWQVTYSDISKQLSAESLDILANYRRLSRDI